MTKRARGCRHPDVTARDLRGVDIRHPVWCPHAVICLDCGAWLPLGPSRDDGPHAEQVAVEVIAAHFVSITATNPSWKLLADLGDITDGYIPPHIEAAMLARAIAEHEEGAG